MNRPLAIIALLAAGCAQAPAPVPELREPRQLTRDGTHAEAYFSYDGKKLVLMAQRAGDRADQIYELDLATTSLTRVSNGKGRTTCGYYLPDGRLLYSSTHHHGDEPPTPPDHSRGYVWGLYRTYDVFLREKDGTLKQLTDNDGYDAETTVSPDGSRLVFTSHRDGGIGLYTMKPDGSDLRKVNHQGLLESLQRGASRGAAQAP